MANYRWSERDKTEYKYRNWDEYDSDNDFNPFKDLIQRDEAVCDNCFALRYDIVSFEWWRASFGWSTYNLRTAIPHRNERIPSEHGQKNACSNCGCQMGLKFRPVPKDRIRDYAENISQVLDAKEISHDFDVLLDTVEELNNSENQGKQDSHVFAPALKLCLE